MFTRSIDKGLGWLPLLAVPQLAGIIQEIIITTYGIKVNQESVLHRGHRRTVD